MLTTNYTPGVPNWIDLGSPDIDGAVAFYTGVFGWEFQSLGPEAGGYGFFRQDGRTVAALGPLTDGEAVAAWTVYFQTADADATAKAVVEAGGKVRVDPFDVFTNGRMAQLTDPGEAEFAIWQPGDTDGLDLVGALGSLSWVELQSPDVEAAQAFYRAVLGWTAARTPVAGGQYTVFTPAGGGENSEVAGVAEVPEGHPPHWLPYFEVADVDAAAVRTEEFGGTVVLPAVDVDGVGRLAWLADRYSAKFAVVTSVPA
ncbi:VOC family protein [Actinosynnema sp. NPDC047251]|uniref:Doxorubicin biosynthesis enzyme n=1 Tax=Saccharothrix espanaensis (strain ATCC 51144 / DSM 44229 / JCM 9112 / NBRC 15066 / NRRL 15764) TaxID=1179773 RepID=K0K1J1_SACES|nr:VOC family protein [Saccharothrix espanaensis]CCH31437.1 Doxorubicin biosynthesis enzyme [Saccharothrix espanaensis DSM 44229]